MSGKCLLLCLSMFYSLHICEILLPIFAVAKKLSLWVPKKV
jgi:hypothetical protein